ncbi:hypothetical protein NE634_20620, partial [Lacrimispora saccharolytica]|nr:hypothetical protein [Lacrimispora saccharolytica]
KKARTILWAITGTLVFASSAAITSAYFTSTDQTVRNILTSGTVRGELTETDWEEKNGEHLLPGESRKKTRQSVMQERWLPGCFWKWKYQ